MEADNFTWYSFKETANCPVLVWAEPQQGSQEVVDLDGESLETLEEEGKSEAGQGGSPKGCAVRQVTTMPTIPPGSSGSQCRA